MAATTLIEYKLDDFFRIKPFALYLAAKYMIVGNLIFFNQM